MKAWFNEQPVLQPHPSNPEKWMIFFQDWCFFIDGVPYWVPKGYWYDGASIPAPFWVVIDPPTAPIMWAPAGAHDPFYLVQKNRPMADEVLFQFCVQNKVPLWKARAIWGAVRACGYPAWCNSKADKAELDSVRKMIYARPDSAKFDTLWKIAA